MRRLALVPLLAVTSLVVLSACSDDSSPLETGDEGVHSQPAGSLQITTITMGQDIDADGYTAALDCGCFETVGVNEIATMTDVTEGSHMVLLTSVAANCELDGPNPRWITVTAGETAQTTFSIVCHGYR
ncbi:MAG: hypothetical protein KJO06_05010 [Gemmatimonadetes bacterium]|nr:hypothetical protein [Gemmatimonadota bacterium]